MEIYEFIRGYGNSNNYSSRNMYEGNYENSSRSVNSRGYKVSKLDKLGEYKVLGGEPININSPAYSSL